MALFRSKPKDPEAPKISRRPEMVASALLLGYTAVRTWLVKDHVSPDTDVDWRIFLGLEIATTWPYAKGMGTLIRSAQNPDAFTRKQKVSAGVVAGTSFMAPYAYVIAEGEGMPAGSWVGAGAFAVAGIAMAVRDVRRARQEHDPELATDEAVPPAADAGPDETEPYAQA